MQLGISRLTAAACFGCCGTMNTPASNPNRKYSSSATRRLLQAQWRLHEMPRTHFALVVGARDDLGAVEPVSCAYAGSPKLTDSKRGRTQPPLRVFGPAAVATRRLGIERQIGKPHAAFLPPFDRHLAQQDAVAGMERLRNAAVPKIVLASTRTSRPDTSPSTMHSGDTNRLRACARCRSPQIVRVRSIDSPGLSAQVSVRDRAQGCCERARGRRAIRPAPSALPRSARR